MHFTKYCLWFFLSEFVSDIKGRQYTLTGSTIFAALGENFTWTCGMFVPINQTANGIIFRRNGTKTVIMGYEENCRKDITDYRYIYGCQSKYVYTLMIPAVNMTEYEQGSKWRCEYVDTTVNIKSPTLVLNISIDVYNVSLSPMGSTLTIVEAYNRSVSCIVNRNAVPAPNITWFIGSKNIASITETHTTSTIITGNRDENTKTLQCSATNSKQPPKTATTTLNIEYPPTVYIMNQENIIEGKDLFVTCQAKPGNPSLTTFSWTKKDSQKLEQNGANLTLTTIQRNESGTYTCTATNIYSDNLGKGTHSQTLIVNVFYSPYVDTLSQQNIIEGRNLSVTCQATPGNPSSTTYYWTKAGNPGFRPNGATLQLPNIQRNSSGTYICTAENNYSNGEKGTHSQPMVVNVLYPPSVDKLPQQNITEGRNLSVTCTVTPGNPNSTTVHWTKLDNPGIRWKGPTLQLLNIPRTSSGIYKCTAENIYIDKENGTHSQHMVVNVQYNPIIEGKLHQIVNESESVTLSLLITSNPLSNVIWYDNNEKLSTRETIHSEMFTHNITSSFSIATAECTDTKNFTVVTSNGKGQIVEALVELIVNCKPNPDRINITLGVTDQSGIEFSTTVIGYPEPRYYLKNENGTTNIKMKDTFTRNAVNNFTIHFNQTIVGQSDYGSYYLTLNNTFGETIVMVNVISQRRPDSPRNVKVTCEETRAKVQWISSFNGGDRQKFTVTAFSGQSGISFSNSASDKGENIIHMKYVENLQSSTEYVFYVSAQNQHGIRSSENITCKTLERGSNYDMRIIAGSAAAGGIALAIAIIIVVILLRKNIKIEKSAKHVERLNNVNENEENDADVDGLKENSLYVSAGPRDVEKPEVVVYAAVAKKIPQTDNNSNLYADVKKSGRQDTNKRTMSSDVKPKKGLFKKDEKAKHKKGKKPKNRPGEADVYENSEDIAMSTNVDNVYSNAGQKDLNKQEERGYKNKDGLLYVEVNFDGKQGQDNPVIHGEDEKTDYATVEFPMPSALHKASGSEEL